MRIQGPIRSEIALVLYDRERPIAPPQKPFYKRRVSCARPAIAAWAANGAFNTILHVYQPEAEVVERSELKR